MCDILNSKLAGTMHPSELDYDLVSHEHHAAFRSAVLKFIAFLSRASHQLIDMSQTV